MTFLLISKWGIQYLFIGVDDMLLWCVSDSDEVRNSRLRVESRRPELRAPEEEPLFMFGKRHSPSAGSDRVYD